MRRFNTFRRVLFLTTLGFSFTLTGSPVEGQNRPQELDGPQFGIGYVANAPEAMAGGGAYVIMPWLGGIGIYLDAKFDVENPSDSKEFESGLTAAQVATQVSGARFIEKEASWRSFNAAVIRPLNPYLFVYGGLGFTRRTSFWEYEEPSQTLGRGGVFWVEAVAEEETRMNAMIGIMMRMGPRVSSQIGFETQPRGVTAGLNLRLPSW